MAHVVLGVSFLLFLALAGEAVVRMADLPFPGSVLGLAAFLAILLSPIGDTVERLIAPGGDLLIVILPLLLVPLAVGVVDLVGMTADVALGLIISLIAGWLVAFTVTAALASLFRRRAPR